MYFLLLVFQFGAKATTESVVQAGASRSLVLLSFSFRVLFFAATLPQL
jgi:hypothetical protein